MTWFNRRPARRPHPDPARELELQRILDLRASIDRRADLIKQYRDAIYGLHLDARQSRRQDAEVLLREVAVLHDRINATEEAIERAGEQIAKLQAGISPDDLAFL